jgi:hypothetical protein
VTETASPGDAGRPDPAAAVTAGEFVEALRRLKRWSGMGYRQLAKHAAGAGYALPRSTLTVALNRGTLPREELVVASVRTCGCDEDTVARWIGARRRIAATGGPDGPGPAARLLGYRRLQVPDGRERPDVRDEDEDGEYAETLELVNGELAERHTRQAASNASLETRSFLLAGFVAVAGPFLAARHAQAGLQWVALGAYGLSFIAGVAALAAGSPRDAPPARTLVEDYGRQPKAQALARLAAARVAVLQENSARQRRKAQCWWVALAALGTATLLSVLAILLA